MEPLIELYEQMHRAIRDYFNAKHVEDPKAVMAAYQKIMELDSKICDQITDWRGH